MGEQPEDEISEHVGEVLSSIAGTLRAVTGNDFTDTSGTRSSGRVQRRMQVTQSPDLDAYAAMLRKDRNEVHRLFQDLLIGVHAILPRREGIQGAGEGDPAPVRGQGAVGSVAGVGAGCATGEEAYSIGILLSEYLKSIDNGPTIQIFATDLDARALGRPERGAIRARLPNM